MAGQKLRDIVIVLPGISGSVLQKDGRDVWAISGQAALGALTSLGGSIRQIRLGQDDPTLDDLGDGITAPRMIMDAHLVPGLVKIDGYTQTIRALTDHFDVTTGALDGSGPPANFFAFPYDWRRDNRVAARKLKQLIDRELPRWRQHSGASNARVILLAHSMGGLIARYYLEVMEGWRDCRALVTFGTPYRGSINAIHYLANGYKQLFVDLSDVMRSLTSVYQLLPIYKVLRIGNTFSRIAETDGVPGVVRDRAASALAFHREIEAAVKQHRQLGEYWENGYRIVPIVGTHQPTWQSVDLVNGAIVAGNSLPGGVPAALGDGDGTVPRVSAIPIELSDEYRETYAPERHGSLQHNAAILTDLVSRIQQMQSEGVEEVRGAGEPGAAPEPSALGVALDDAYRADEPIVLHATLHNVAEPEAVGAPRAIIEPIDGAGTPITSAFVPEGDGWTARIDALPPGAYRLTVLTPLRTALAPPPVHDIFVVAG